MTPTNPKMNVSKQVFSNAMRREIYEQPTAIAKTVAMHLKDDIIFPGELVAIESALLTFEKLIIAASGSSRHADRLPCWCGDKTRGSITGSWNDRSAPPLKLPREGQTSRRYARLSLCT